MKGPEVPYCYFKEPYNLIWLKLVQWCP